MNYCQDCDEELTDGQAYYLTRPGQRGEVLCAKCYEAAVALEETEEE